MTSLSSPKQGSDSEYYVIDGRQHEYYYEDGQRLPCFIKGIAYDTLVTKEDNGGIISPETMRLIQHDALDTVVSCGYDVSTQDRIYRDPAIKLTMKDISTMPLVGGNVEYDHSKSGGRGVIGRVTQTWVQNKKLHMEAAIHDSLVAKAVRSKQLNGISMGYTVLRNGNRVTGKVFREVSICPDPVFPQCKIYVNASRNTEGSNTPVLGDERSESGSGFYIDSVSDKPIENEIKFLNHDISSVGSLFRLPVRRFSQKMEQAAPVASTTQQSLPPQIPSSVPQVSPLESERVAKPVEREENHLDRSTVEKPYAKEKEKEKKFLKAQKYDEYKRIAKQAELEKAAERQRYLAAQSSNKDAFLNHYAQFIKETGRDITEEEKGIIENSYALPDFSKWAEGLDHMRQKQSKLAEDNAQLKKSVEELAERENTLKRKLGKTKAAVKYLRLEGGEKMKIKQSPSLEEKTEKNSVASSIPAVFNLGRNVPQATKPRTYGHSPIENAFMKTNSSINVAASRNSGSGYMSRLPDDLKDVMNSYTNADPADDAWQFLKKVPAYQPGVSMRSGF